MKKVFTLLTLLVAIVTGAWASTVSDLVTISNNYTFISDNITSNGTVKLTADKLYDDGRIFAPTANSVNTGKGSVTIAGVSHLNSLRLKNTQDQLCFKVAGPCVVTFYTQSHSSRGIQVGSTEGGTEYGSQTASTTEWSCNITAAGVVYLSSYGGDFYFAGFKVVFPKPDITTQPVSSAYQKDAVATALSVEATASAGELSYQWYSCDNAEKANAAEIDGATSASYTPATSATGTFYYFCRVTDSNGYTDSDVATITVANAYAPIVIPTATSLEVLQYESATLEVSVDAIPAATIQWYSCDDAEKANPVAIVGATETTYSPSTETTGTYYFYAVATNAQGATTSDVFMLTVNADITGQTFYSWNQGTETGGTAVASDNESVGWANATYNTIRLNGKSDFSDKTVTITLTNALKAGDQIKVTGYRNKNDKDKQAAFKAKFEKGASTVASSTGLEFVNIDTSDASAEDSNRGTEPNTCVFSVPANAAGSKTITMTRSHTATNLFITKIEIYRPTINFSATLNAAGLLTADEIANTSNFNFGLTANGERVAADAANAVATLNGKYHNDHGCTNLTITAAVTKPVKITIGQCTYSKSQVTIKNSSSENVALLNPNSPACWKNSASNVDVFYYTGAATTLTISGMSYCPYVAIEEIEASDAAVAITPAYEKTTYVSTMPLDFSGIDGLKAYRAAAAADGSVTLTEVTTVPPATPLVLVGTASKKYSVPVSSSLAAVGTNLLKAGDGSTEFNGSTYDYILFTDGLFYQIGNGTVATTKAYLHCDSDPTSAGAPNLMLVFGDMQTTGVNDVRGKMADVRGDFFDLQGRKVANPTKGLYIVNGKKVIIK